MTNDHIVQELKRAGVKPTAQRVLILDYMHKNHTHPSSEQIYQDLQSKIAVLSRATIYNTMNTFVERGLIRALNTGDDVTHYDIELHEHAHFQCKYCHRIWDIDLPDQAMPEPELPENFSLDCTQLMLSGGCNDCNKKMKVCGA